MLKSKRPASSYPVMKTLQASLAVSCLLWIGLAAPAPLDAAESSQPESRKSPYFIDGLHCEGLDGLETGDDLTRAYPDEVADMGIKTRHQEQCEWIFEKSGVRKFQWVTPEDLEKLDFILKHSRKFAAAAIRIEKSELQNHIHLIGRFEMFEPKTFYQLRLSQGLERDQTDGDRNTSDVEAKFHFKKRGTINPAPFVLGFKYRSTDAAAPMNHNDLSRNGKGVTFTSEEKIAQSRTDATYGAVTTRFQQANGFFFSFALESSHMSGDSESTLDTHFETGVETQLDPLLPSVTRLSLLYSNYSVEGGEFYASKARGKNYRSIAFAGLAEDIQTRWVKGKIELYRSLTPELHYFLNMDLAAPLLTYASVTHSLGISGGSIRGAVLPEHRFGLPDRTVIQYFYQGEEGFSLTGYDLKVGLKVGLATYKAINNLDTPYSQDQAFAELGLKTKTDDFETTFAFLYGNRRLY